MAKSRHEYVCRECGYRSPKSLGRCIKCGEWDSMEEVMVVDAPKSVSAKKSYVVSNSVPRRLGEITEDENPRIHFGMSEMERVLGGGIVPGSITLISGDPGIGKSTLLLQTALKFSETLKVLYVSGEESERQIKMRAKRLADAEKFSDNLFLVTETNLDAIHGYLVNLNPDLLILDSIQTTYIPTKDSSAGTVTQVRECSSMLREYAKSTGTSVFLIGHVTKDGNIAGPRTLEHIVDTVLYLEGDRFQSYRLLRSVKNRFGATYEVGVFEMSNMGLLEVKNPSEAFLAERMVNAAGSAIAVPMEGTRPLLVEIQGLTSPTSFGNPRRTANGLDFNRLQLITAVLIRRLGYRLGEQDIFANVVGGLKIDEPAADLAIAAAIASSMRDKPIQADCVLIGEIGLSGELRAIRQLEARLNEAEKLGFRKAIIPKRLGRKGEIASTMEVIEARTVKQAFYFAFGEHDNS